jgi:uncharacterized membrane protein YeiH
MVLHYLFILGVCVESITGAIAAGRKKMDFVGVIVIACITALGGGTVRDILFNTYPMTWVTHPELLVYTSCCAFLTIFIAHSLTRIMRVFLILDALGLAVFTILGTQKILAHGMSSSVAIISGLVTGICGGMLRDILCNDIPLVLRKELYAVIAFVGALLYVFLERTSLNENMIVVITLVTIFSARSLAIFFNIEVPKFDYAMSLRRRRKNRK